MSVKEAWRRDDVITTRAPVCTNDDVITMCVMVFPGMVVHRIQTAIQVISNTSLTTQDKDSQIVEEFLQETENVDLSSRADSMTSNASSTVNLGPVPKRKMTVVDNEARRKQKNKKFGFGETTEFGHSRSKDRYAAAVLISFQRKFTAKPERLRKKSMVFGRWQAIKHKRQKSVIFDPIPQVDGNVTEGVSESNLHNPTRPSGEANQHADGSGLTSGGHIVSFTDETRDGASPATADLTQGSGITGSDEFPRKMSRLRDEKRKRRKQTHRGVQFQNESDSTISDNKTEEKTSSDQNAARLPSILHRKQEPEIPPQPAGLDDVDQGDGAHVSKRNSAIEMHGLGSNLPNEYAVVDLPVVKTSLWDYYAYI